MMPKIDQSTVWGAVRDWFAPNLPAAAGSLLQAPARRCGEAMEEDYPRSVRMHRSLVREIQPSARPAGAAGTCSPPAATSSQSGVAPAACSPPDSKAADSPPTTARASRVVERPTHMLARRCAQLEAGANLSAAPSISQKLRELLDAAEPARLGANAAAAGAYAALFAGAGAGLAPAATPTGAPLVESCGSSSAALGPRQADASQRGDVAQRALSAAAARNAEAATALVAEVMRFGIATAPAGAADALFLGSTLGAPSSPAPPVRDRESERREAEALEASAQGEAISSYLRSTLALLGHATAPRQDRNDSSPDHSHPNRDGRNTLPPPSGAASARRAVVGSAFGDGGVEVDAGAGVAGGYGRTHTHDAATSPHTDSVTAQHSAFILQETTEAEEEVYDTAGEGMYDAAGEGARGAEVGLSTALEALRSQSEGISALLRGLVGTHGNRWGPSGVAPGAASGSGAASDLDPGGTIGGGAAAGMRGGVAGRRCASRGYEGGGGSGGTEVRICIYIYI